MRVKLKDLRANPYRDIDNYPMDEKKIDAIVESINETGFWGGIQARKFKGEIQIAYGHHRLAAVIKVYGLDYIIDLPVTDLSDAAMFKMMARENMEDREVTTRLIDETVVSGYKFLDSHPEEYRKLWNDCGQPLKKFTKVNSVNEAHHLRDSITSIGMMHKLTGYSESRVQKSMKRIESSKEDHVDEETVKDVTSNTKSSGFVQALDDLKKHHDITLTEATQKRIAKMLEDNKFGGNSTSKISIEIKKFVLKEIADEAKKKAEEADNKKDEAAAEREAEKAKSEQLLMTFEGYLKKTHKISNQYKKLTEEMLVLQEKMIEHKVSDKDMFIDLALVIRKINKNTEELMAAWGVNK